MKFKLKLISFLSFLVVFFSCFNKSVLAYSYWDICDSPYATWYDYYYFGCYYYSCTDIGDCSNTGECNKTDVCNSKPCGATSTACCPDAISWTKYNVKCNSETKWIDSWSGGYYETRCFNVYTPTTEKVCSLADKCISGEHGLRAGYCECGSYSSSIYKECCDNVTGALTTKSCVASGTQDGYFPDEGVCPSGTHSHIITSDGHCCSPSTGSSGVCGVAAGLSTCSAPSSDLCANGTVAWVDNTGGDGTFNWQCLGTAGSCGGANGTTVNCSSIHTPDVSGTCGASAGGNFVSAPTSDFCGTSYGYVWNDSVGSDGTFNWTCNGQCSGTDLGCAATRNFPPVFGGLVIKNNLNNTVASEVGNKNQICQTSFNENRSVTFEISMSDPDGISDINSATLIWNGHNIPIKSAIGATTIFGTTFPDTWNDVSTYPLVVTITDKKGQITSDSSRNFKLWNCQVSVSGAGYDGSATGAVCADTNSFLKKIPGTVTYSLTMNDAASGSPTDDRIMTVNSPDYTSGAATLTWGRGYIFEVGNLAGVNPSFRINGTSCVGSQFTINNTVANPYSASVSFTADFTAVLDQDPWWQTKNGGALSNLSIDDQVPVTCTLPSCKISDGALVASPNIDNNSGKSVSEAQVWYYQSPAATLVNVNQNYTYFFDQYFVKNNIGTTLVGDKTMSEIKALSPTGIYFINGNLAIDTDNSLTGNQFLMIIVKGNINIANTVNQVNGIFVADNMAAAGTSATKLTIKGSLFAANEISFSRGYITKVTNNTTPAVVVEHNPQLIFNLPGKLAKVLTNWQWGN